MDRILEWCFKPRPVSEFQSSGTPTNGSPTRMRLSASGQARTDWRPKGEPTIVSGLNWDQPPAHDNLGLVHRAFMKNSAPIVCMKGFIIYSSQTLIQGIWPRFLAEAGIGAPTESSRDRSVCELSEAEPTTLGGWWRWSDRSGGKKLRRSWP